MNNKDIYELNNELDNIYNLLSQNFKHFNNVSNKNFNLKISNSSSEVIYNKKKFSDAQNSVLRAMSSVKCAILELQKVKINDKEV